MSCEYSTLCYAFHLLDSNLILKIFMPPLPAPENTQLSKDTVSDSGTAERSHYCGPFPGCSDSEESTCSVRDLDSIPGSGRSPGEGNGYPLQYSGLEKPMYKGAWQALYSPWGP